MSRRRLVMAGVVAGSVVGGALIGAVAFTPGVGLAATDAASGEGVATICERVLGGGPLEAAAEAIGIEPSELLTETRDGATIAEVAQAHGVEPSTVVDAIVADQRARLDRAVQDGLLTQEEADERAAALEEHVTDFVSGDVDLPFLDGPRGDGPPLGHPGMWGFADGPVAVAADAIGIRPAALLAELRDGSTIADVARAHDVAVSVVVDAVASALQERLDAAVDAGWITQEEADERAADLDEQATSIVNGDLAPFPFPGPFGPPDGWFGGDGGADAGTTEVSLA
jgi:transposase-like protein